MDKYKRNCAVLLGATHLVNKNEYNMFGFIPNMTENDNPFYFTEQMPFDSDYNWCMAVMRKISNLGYEFEIGNNKCILRGTNFYCYRKGKDITPLYKVICKFIDFYKKSHDFERNSYNSNHEHWRAIQWKEDNSIDIQPFGVGKFIKDLHYEEDEERLYWVDSIDLLNVGTEHEEFIIVDEEKYTEYEKIN